MKPVHVVVMIDKVRDRVDPFAARAIADAPDVRVAVTFDAETFPFRAKAPGEATFPIELPDGEMIDATVDVVEADHDPAWLATWGPLFLRTLPAPSLAPPDPDDRNAERRAFFANAPAKILETDRVRAVETLNELFTVIRDMELHGRDGAHAASLMIRRAITRLTPTG